jgi:serine/threonine protein kinase
MSLCFNIACPRPQNPAAHRFCHGCGHPLRLGDRYEAVQVLGQGANSHTFLGRDRRRVVAPQCLIKAFTPMGDTPRARAAAADQFRQDVARLDAVSQHPHLPNLRAFFEGDRDTYRVQYLVQDLVIGERLDQRLQAWGPLDSAAASILLGQGLALLHHLHSHRILHRDIKPANLLRRPPQDHWCLVDLGAAKPLTAEPTTASGTLIGSAEYAAPEQLRGAATYASDLYSLGVVCLHALTGLRPFDLFDEGAGCWRWRSLVPDVDATLADLIDRLVQPHPRDRLPDAAAGLAALGLSPPTAPPPTRTAPVSPPRAPWSALQRGQTLGDLKTAVALGTHLCGLHQRGDLHLQSLQNWAAAPVAVSPTPPQGTALTRHPHRPWLALGTRTGDIWLGQSTADPAGNGAPRLTWQGPLKRHRAAISQLAFYGPDHLISGDEGGVLTLWHWPTGQQHPMGQRTGAITALAVPAAIPLEPTATGQAGTEQRVTGSTGLGTEPGAEGSAAPRPSAEAEPDTAEAGVCAMGDRNGAVEIWSLPTRDRPGRPYLLRTLVHHGGAIGTLAWGDGAQVVVSGGWDMQLQWRRAATGAVLQQVTAAGFLLPPRSLLFLGAGTWLSGSQDGYLQYWHQGQDTAIATVRLGSSPLIALLPIGLPQPPDTANADTAHARVSATEQPSHDLPSHSHYLSVSQDGTLALWPLPSPLPKGQ